VLAAGGAGLISAFIFCFTLCWNEFIYALTFISSTQNRRSRSRSSTSSSTATSTWLAHRGALVGSLPLVILYAFFVEHLRLGDDGGGQGIDEPDFCWHLRKGCARRGPMRARTEAASRTHDGPERESAMDVDTVNPWRSPPVSRSIMRPARGFGFAPASVPRRGAFLFEGCQQKSGRLFLDRPRHRRGRSARRRRRRGSPSGSERPAPPP